MSDEVKDNVVGLGNAIFNQTNSQYLVSEFADALNQFNNKGANATAVVHLIFTDEGAYNVAWNTALSKLPAAAIIGMAYRTAMELNLANFRIEIEKDA